MKLSAYLKQVNMTYGQFAQKIGMKGKHSAVTLSRYSKGERVPRKDRALKIIDACDGMVTLEDLYGG